MKDNFLDRMNSKLQASGVKGRQDLEMNDAKVVEAGRAVRVLATYSSLYGTPSVHDIKSWVDGRLGEFGQHVVLRADTIAAFPEKDFVTFIVEKKVLRQPESATKGMIKAGVDQFIDNDQVLWEVVKADQGPGYIVRKDGVTIEQMLEVRKAALRGGVSARKQVLLANMDTIPTASGGFANVDLGDTVDFYSDGNIHRGKVQSVNASGVKIASGSGVYTVDPQAITAVVEKGTAAGKEQDDVMRRYFSLVYPGNPAMTEIISPSSSKPIKDPRALDVQPISVDASTKGPAANPTQRVLGKLPGTPSAGNKPQR